MGRAHMLPNAEKPQLTVCPAPETSVEKPAPVSARAVGCVLTPHAGRPVEEGWIGLLTRKRESMSCLVFKS